MKAAKQWLLLKYCLQSLLFKINCCSYIHFRWSSFSCSYTHFRWSSCKFSYIHFLWSSYSCSYIHFRWRNCRCSSLQKKKIVLQPLILNYHELLGSWNHKSRFGTGILHCSQRLYHKTIPLCEKLHLIWKVNQIYSLIPPYRSYFLF